MDAKLILDQDIVAQEQKRPYKPNIVSPTVKELTGIIRLEEDDKRRKFLHKDYAMKQSNVLSYKGYIGTIEYDNEAKIFYGRVINTQDTITFQSDDAKQLEYEFQVSVDAYLDFCKELGESPEKHQAMVVVAQLAHKSLNKWAAEYLVVSDL